MALKIWSDDSNVMWRALKRLAGSGFFLHAATLIAIGAVALGARDVIQSLLPHNLKDAVLPGGAIFIATGLGIILFNYLQGGANSPVRREDRKLAVDKLMAEIAELKDVLVQHKVVKGRDGQLLKFRNPPQDIALEVIESNQNEGEEATASVKTTIHEALTNEFLTIIEQQYGVSILKNSQYSSLMRDFEDLRTRLLQEVSALHRRANFNLAIGGTTTLLAISFLAYIVLKPNISFDSTKDILSHYIPKISFVAFIETFSYFFLRLYKANLSDVKFYQNELTNIEAKLIAVKTALLQKNDDALRKVIEELSKTERNFVLKRGETTVELERNKLEGRSAEIIRKAMDALAKADKD